MQAQTQAGYATFEDACREQDARIATAQIGALPTVEYANVYTLHVSGAKHPSMNGRRDIGADDIAEAVEIARQETGASTACIAVLAEVPADPPVDACLMPPGAERYA